MSTLSPLTTLSTITSPSASYRTASEGTPNNLEDVTEASSPGERDAAPKTPYRDARQLPRVLRQRCQIHLEEQYYVAAINLLNSLLCAGASQPYAPSRPALIPPPAQISVLATLAIHPTHTSRIGDSEQHEISSLSLSYLRNLLATTGPVNANLRDAFVFRDSSRRSRRSDGAACEASDSDEDHIRGKTANDGSVWTKGQDFWKVLGWAFNCSALYPHRWRWWKPWLEFLVDVLEVDYEERKRRDQEAHERIGTPGLCAYELLQDSLLVAYVAPKKSRANPVKPIMSALFADGGASSLVIYKEIFRNEQKIPSKKSKKRKRDRVDLENDKFGDYNEDSSTGGSEPPTPEKATRGARKVEDAPSWEDSWLLDTISLRLRLFALVSKASVDIPQKCTVKTYELYDHFEERIRQLPLPAFSRFIAPSESPVQDFVLISIIRSMMPALLPTAAPDPAKVDPVTDEKFGCSIAILEECFLPFAHKATVQANAQLSLALESLFRIVWRSAEGLCWTTSLQEAVEKGVKARKAKALTKKGKGEQAAKDVLLASSNRLMALIGILGM